MISISVPSCVDSYLRRCLDSIRKSEPRIELGRVVVGDNGISEATRKQYPWVEFIPVPGGEDFVFSKAHNLCVARMPAEADLLFLNDDTQVLTPSFLSILEDLLRSPQAQGFGIISLHIQGGVGNEEQAVGVAAGEMRETKRTVCFVACLIRRKAWDEIGPMDERFVAYGHDDDDMCHRMRLAGWRVGITGAVMVKHGMDGHPHSSSYARNSREDRQVRERWERQSALNLRLFVEKWGKLPWDPVR